MQAAPVRPTSVTEAVATAATAISGRPALTRPALARPALTRPALTALRAVETLFLSGGQRTARRNAWTAVLEDRRRAKDRVETEHVLEAVSDATSHAP
ncbi:hypothetical protein AB0O07_12405 [Streptomyces sp. NPDC093085]|uniref:SCO2195 family GlnR-regulated protein n=1 Tax=Streptomyces sp. NPDC093085 TaxID=3155068 RepID=UPI00341362DA